MGSTTTAAIRARQGPGILHMPEFSQTFLYDTAVVGYWRTAWADVRLARVPSADGPSEDPMKRIRSLSTLCRLVAVRTLPTLAACATLFAAPTWAADDEAPAEAAEADDVEEEELPNVELVRTPDRPMPADTPLIDNKKFPMAGRLELSGTIDLSYGDRYIKQWGGRASAGFHIFDWLAVEGYVGYIGACGLNTRTNPSTGGTEIVPPWESCELNITQFARNEGRSANDGSDQLYLSDLWQTNGLGGVTVMWSPIYGKLSAVSELELNFQLYALGGAGIDGIWKVKTDRTATSIGKTMEWAPTFVVPSGHFGAGLRFIPWKYLALRAELRNYVKVTPGPVAAPGEAEEQFDIGFTSMVTLGASFLF